MVVVAFQSAFHVEMYQNDFFYFLKLFLRSAHQTKHTKKIEFFKNTDSPTFPNAS
jgi:hypothetical protein